MGHARWCKEKVCLEIVLLVTVGLLESSRSKVNLPKCTMHFCGNVCGFWNSSFRESSLLSAKSWICLLWICFVSVEPPRGNGRIPDFNLHYVQNTKVFYLIRYFLHIYTQHTDPLFVGSILTLRWGVCLRVISCLCWPSVLVVFLVNVPARLGGWRIFDDFCWGWTGAYTPNRNVWKPNKKCWERRLQPLPVSRISESTDSNIPLSSWNGLGFVGTRNIYSSIICNFKKH